MGPVEAAVRNHISPGDELRTPTGRPFSVAEIDLDGVVLLLGASEARTRLPWRALETVPDLLDGRGWVKTSGSFETEVDPRSLSGHLKRYLKRETANWVAVVLETAGVLELDREPPIRARLVEGWRT